MSNILEIISKAGNEEIASVYLGKTKNGQIVEFVESTQPPLPREEKWVLIVSTLFGCPVACPICDAGGWYKGKLSKDEIFAQIDYLVSHRYPNKKITSNKFKIQFARMGEPILNPAVLDVLKELPTRYDAPGLLPSLSTVAPESSNGFLDELITVKNQHYANGNFQMQFSIHTTDQLLRDKIIPIKKWDFTKIAAYGKAFKKSSDKKITLNFALAKMHPLSVDILKQYFDPNIFIIKITPVNPTINAANNKIESYFIDGNSNEDKEQLLDKITAAGYEVILSIGELEENKIGSNCGQYVKRFLNSGSVKNDKMYTYDQESA